MQEGFFGRPKFHCYTSNVLAVMFLRINVIIKY